MHQFSIDRVVAAPVEQVWSILDDFGGVHRFHPRVERSPIVNGQASGVGAQRVCHFYDGTSIKEEITNLTEGKSMDVAIIDGALPLNDAVATISVEPVDASSTRVTFSLAYTPKYGPLGKLMNFAMIRPKFSKILATVIEGLETHARTGAVVGEDGAAMAAAAS